jgi:predicted ATPase
VINTSPDTGKHSGVTDLVGRKPELTAIAGLLDRARLVTVTGPGGVGKTRVALAAAAEAVDDYPDGVWIVELSGLRDPELLPNTVASVLGLPEQDTRSQLDTVLDYLRDREMLLILDTCEHIVDACARLADEILRAAPGITLLATSRQPLDASGEHTHAVPPLPVPETDDAFSRQAYAGAGDAGAGDAVELFALRAAAAVPGFTLTPANWPDVTHLCRRLDGIPLAIELAAVQLRAMQLDDLTLRLDQTFKILTGDSRVSLARHETLRAAIEWSHDLCSPAERRLWARLSVFAGTFDFDAVLEVCARTGLEREDVVVALVGLVDKSVVLRDPADERRYRLLDTLREFGAEQLAAADEVTECRDRHLARYLRLAQNFGAHFTDDDQMKQYFALRADHANIRAALEHALESQDGAFRERDGAELATALYGYWQISGLLREGGYWLSKVIDRFAGASPERAKALVNRGFLRSFQGHADALADCQDGTETALALDEPAIAARGYMHMGLTLAFTGEHAASARVLETARPMLAECGDRPGQVMLMPMIGHLRQLSGDIAGAIEVCDSGLELLGPESTEQWVRSYMHVVSGFALFQLPGREADCEAVVREALAAKQALGDLIGTAYALETLGWLAARTGGHSQAAWLFGAADPLWQRGGSRFSGTAIMEGFHQQAEQTAVAALGAGQYATFHADGSRHAKEQLTVLAMGGTFALRVP